MFKGKIFTCIREAFATLCGAVSAICSLLKPYIHCFPEGAPHPRIGVVSVAASQL
jgi:hypothetical protein